MTEQKLKGTMVPINFIYENEQGEEEDFVVEMDSQVFYNLCQEALNQGIRVEDLLINNLLRYMEETDGDRS